MENRAYELLPQLLSEVRAFAITQHIAVKAEMVSVVAKGKLVYDLATLIGDDASQYDLRYPKIEVLAKNLNTASPSAGKYVNADAVVVVSSTAAGVVEVQNTTNKSLDLRIYITVTKKD